MHDGLPLCGPRHAHHFDEGRWVPLSARAATSAACTAAAAFPHHCPQTFGPPSGRDMLLEFVPTHCRLPSAVSLQSGAEVARKAVGEGNVLRFIGDSIASDHFKYFAACLVNCNMRKIAQVCQADRQGGGAVTPTFGNGTRRCDVQESVPFDGQLVYDLASSMRWDWRQALLDAGFAGRDADHAIKHVRSNIQHEQSASGCILGGNGSSHFYANGTLLRGLGMAHVDFRCAATVARLYDLCGGQVCARLVVAGA